MYCFRPKMLQRSLMIPPHHHSSLKQHYSQSSFHDHCQAVLSLTFLTKFHNLRDMEYCIGCQHSRQKLSKEQRLLQAAVVCAVLPKISLSNARQLLLILVADEFHHINDRGGKKGSLHQMLDRVFLLAMHKLKKTED